MPKAVKRQQPVQGRAKARPAFIVSTKSLRVRRWQLRLWHKRQLTISLRRFRTQPERRSARVTQRVYPITLFGYRELAVALTAKKVRRRTARKAQANQTFVAKFLSPAIVLLLGIVGSVYFGFNLKQPVNLAPLHASADSVSTPPTPVAPTPKTLPRSIPTHITIPKIGLDTSIVPTDLNNAGTIAVPDDYRVTGWYNQSPTPGELGPSVIVGHVDYIHSIAVFWRLRELAPGDGIQVQRQDGSTANFTVIEVTSYPQDQFPTDAVYGNINYAGLRLVTCSGIFSHVTHHYNQNLVVYARLAE